MNVAHGGNERRTGRGGVRVGIVDDHALFRDGLVLTVRERGAHTVVVACAGLGDLTSWLHRHPRGAHPQVLLLDLRLGGRLVSADEVKALLAQGMKVLVVSGAGEGALVQDLLRIGVSGFVAKEDSARELLAAIEAAATGNTWTSRELAEIVARDPVRPALSPRELEAVTLYAGGLTMTAVAHRMGVSYDTAREYVERARRKWDAVGREVRTKTELYEAARRDGLLPPAGGTRLQ
ncbi:MAG TPA: response regulator [Kineosporiaceae bacterium]|nr:response regulator [Kineosporiaceae bacterium]